MDSDFDVVRREYLISDIASSYGVNLKKNGKEFIGCCPLHSENTPSFTIFNANDGHQRFHCFGCDESGDILDFVQKVKGVSLSSAVKFLTGGSPGPNMPPKNISKENVYARIKPVSTDMEIAVGTWVEIYNPKRENYGKFLPTAVHPYYSSDGKFYGYVLRRDFNDGRKETPMVMRVVLPDGKECWSRFPFPRPRPLYGSEYIKNGKQVIIVEGEKCADALRETTGRCAISWPGGTYGVKYADWDAIKGCSKVIWPDADSPGLETANNITGLISPHGDPIKIISPPKAGGKSKISFDDWRKGMPVKKGWDCADAISDGWGIDQINSFMASTVKEQRGAKLEVVSDNIGMPPKAKEQMKQVDQPRPAPISNILTGEILGEDELWKMGLARTKEGGVRPTALVNHGLYLENHPETKGLFAFDEFKMQIMLLRCPPWAEQGSSWTPRAIEDRDVTEAVWFLEGKDLSPKPAGTHSVIQAIANRSPYDSLTSYVKNLAWDGVPRIDTWLHKYIGTEDTKYTRLVGSKYLISAVARALDPGCKVDTMPIFEGPQGAEKSSAIKRLFTEEFFSDNLSVIGTKDAIIDLHGVWGLEVAEMDRFGPAKTNEVKKFLTHQIDRYRPPYGRNTVAIKRRCVLAGTINPEGTAYLKDVTGGRRFWPIEVGQISLDEISKDRNQLWAEAVVKFNDGVEWWIPQGQSDEVIFEQEKRTEVDVWTDVIVPLLTGVDQIALSDIFQRLGFQSKETDSRQAARIGRIMMRQGWVASRDTAKGNDRLVYQKIENDEW